MSMTQIVSFLDLAIFPSLALVFFLAAFIAVIWNVFSTSKQEITAAAHIPLDDDVVFTPRRPSIDTESNASTVTTPNGGSSHV